MTNLLALPSETVLAGDYKIRRVLGAGGFGITYLADEIALNRQVTIKEYFPADFAARIDDVDAVPRSKDCAEDYKWGLDRFIEEAQTLARFEHPNIVRVFRYFRENKTGYMVLQFEEGKSLRNWLKELGRAPRQLELDQFLGPLLDALEMIHKRDFLHRDIAPDNIIMRKDRSPVLIDFGSARGEIASQSRTVSALVKPGYSPYEQYATTTSQQGPWTDIYALGATLYQAVTGKRPPDSPSRVVKDEYVPARDAAVGSYRAGFLAAIDKALCVEPKARPQSVLEWRGPLLAPPDKPAPVRQKLAVGLGLRKAREPVPVPTAAVRAPTVAHPPVPDAPQAQGPLLDDIDSLQKPEPARDGVPAKPAATRLGTRLEAAAPRAAPMADDYSSRSDQAGQRHGIGYGPAPMTMLSGAQPSAIPPTPRPAPKRAETRAAPVRAAARVETRSDTGIEPMPVRRVEPMPIRRKKNSLATRATFFLRPTVARTAV
jgi:serine/threonine protein kinase